MPPAKHPEINRVSYAEHAAIVAARTVPPDRAGQVAAAACRLEPLQKIQTAFDQLVAHANTHRSGGVGPYGHDFRGYTRAELEGARRHVEVLEVAADAADAMFGDMLAQLESLETAMAKQKHKDEAEDPKLTTTGEPHPLQAGGYDPDKDPALPGNISDVEALKEGKTTRAQAAAIGRGDAEASEGQEPTPSDEPRPPDDKAQKPSAKAAPAPAPADKHKPKK